MQEVLLSERQIQILACIELKKSDMFWDIAGLINDKVISMDDLEEFSDDLKRNSGPDFEKMKMMH